MKKNNTIRIIAGAYRSRLIEVIDHEGLRPTSNRMRETLFNWIQPYLINGLCLDLFSGSGALGIEALSRGAKHVTFVEKNRTVSQILKKNISDIVKEESLYQIVQQDALEYLTQTKQEYTLIFIDPPFGQPELLQIVLLSLQEHAVFETIQHLVIEQSIHDVFVPSLPNFTMHKEMRTKESSLKLFLNQT